FTGDGKALVTSHKKQTVRSWEVATGTLLHEVRDLPPSDLFALSSQGVLAVDGRDPAPAGAEQGKPAEIHLRLIHTTTVKDAPRRDGPAKPADVVHPRRVLPGRQAARHVRVRQPGTALGSGDGEARPGLAFRRQRARGARLLGRRPTAGAGRRRDGRPPARRRRGRGRFPRGEPHRLLPLPVHFGWRDGADPV